MNKLKFDFISLLLIILMCVILAFFVVFAYSEARQCLSNPFTYGASKMGDVQCSCMQMQGINVYTFSFNDTFFNSGVTEKDIEKERYKAVLMKGFSGG